MFNLASFIIISVSVSLAQAGKRGLAWPYYNSPLDPGVFNNGDGSVVAIYDYETYAPPSTNGDGGLGFIGMQRCLDCDSSPVAELASRAAAQGWATVFSLNEPDLPSSAAFTSPSNAAQWYQANINPLNIKKSLPAVTSSVNSGEGLDWLSSMISACAGNCQYDYINLHWYGNTFGDFQSYVQQAHNEFPNTNIVVTEFALSNPPGGQNDQVAFYQQAFPFLDGLDYVTLYFPFVATSPSLLTTNDPNAVNTVGTGSCLYTDAGQPSAVGNLLF